MPAMNSKNLMVNPGGAAFDLGVGASTQLAEQLQSKMDEIRKRKKGQIGGDTGSAADMLLNPTFGAGASGGTNG